MAAESSNWSDTDCKASRTYGWLTILLAATIVVSPIVVDLVLTLAGNTVLRGEPLPRRGLVEHGAYRWLRHPGYLSFLGLIWFTPHMTLDHALLTGFWTCYIFVGSVLKDRRLEFYLRDEYREYASRVPGYPGMFFGPLARWPKVVLASEQPPARTARPHAA